MDIRDNDVTPEEIARREAWLNSLPFSERRVQIAAARLRVTLDFRLNRKTPRWVIDLAKEKTWID